MLRSARPAVVVPAPMSLPPEKATDEELFAEISRKKAAGEDFRRDLGLLCERWRSSSATVVRRIQNSYRRGSPDDELDVFQDAVGKFMLRGIDQFRGISEQLPGKSASPKTFFLRIVKHAAIDRYRRQREDLADSPADGEEGPADSPAEVGRAIAASQRASERAESGQLYWRAYDRLKEEHPNEAVAWDLYHHQDVDDHQECARILNISVANSYKRVSRAQASLRLYLLDLNEEID